MGWELLQYLELWTQGQLPGRVDFEKRCEDLGQNYNSQFSLRNIKAILTRSNLMNIKLLYLLNLSGTGSLPQCHCTIIQLIFLTGSYRVLPLLAYFPSLPLCFCFLFFSISLIPARRYTPPSFASRGKCNSGSKLLISRLFCCYISFYVFSVLKK